MESALSAITSLFTPSKTTQSPGSEGPEVPHQVPVASTPTINDLPDINQELNTYKDRFALELRYFKKKQLETQSKIEVECTKKNLKSEFEHELRHQSLMQSETINLLKQVDQLHIQLQQQ